MKFFETNTHPSHKNFEHLFYFLFNLSKFLLNRSKTLGCKIKNVQNWFIYQRKKTLTRQSLEHSSTKENHFISNTTIKNEAISEANDQSNIQIKQESLESQQAQIKFENTTNFSKTPFFNANPTLFSPYPINISPFQPCKTTQLAMMSVAQAYYKEALARQQQQYMNFMGINFNFFKQ